MKPASQLNPPKGRRIQQDNWTNGGFTNTLLRPAMKSPRIISAFSLLSVFLLLAVLPGLGLSQDVNRDIEAMNRESKARAAIVKRVSGAVVNIQVEQAIATQAAPPQELLQDDFFRQFFRGIPFPQGGKRSQTASGSGVIVDAKGYILTNSHMVANASKITVKLKDGRTLPAKLVGTDPSTDLAVIKIDSAQLHAASLGDSDDLEVGESVMAIGNPFGFDQTITMGIVSAKGRSGIGVTDYEDFIQTDASINPGNSGGPLVNLKGEVVGINTAIFGERNLGIGFSIPVNMAKQVMEDLIQKGHVTRGFLGIAIQDMTPDLSEALGIRASQGVVIGQVGDDTPASRSGLKDGDVITQYNRKPVKDAQSFRYLVASTAPGTKVPVELWRDGKRMDMELAIGKQPGQMTSGLAPSPADSPHELLGLRVTVMKPTEARSLGYAGLKGLLVSAVMPNSPADQAGINPRSLLLEANRRPLAQVADLRREVERLGHGGKLMLRVRSGDTARFVVITIP
ncbi:MAG: Do family serine endopeptidase [Deltaproteobacteria bacterium]|nr:Do family serine endopeptidase [Deltaproteobacteria bacterium]